jgi:hypothetical protein
MDESLELCSPEGKDRMIKTTNAPAAPALLYDLPYGRIYQRVYCLVHQRELALYLTRETFLKALWALAFQEVGAATGTAGSTALPPIRRLMACAVTDWCPVSPSTP